MRLRGGGECSTITTLRQTRRYREHGRVIIRMSHAEMTDEAIQRSYHEDYTIDL